MTEQRGRVARAALAPTGWSERWLPGVCVLALCGALVYANSLSGPFIFDDTVSIIGNATIRGGVASAFSAPREVPTSGRPIVNASLAINYAAGGLSVRGYHIWNITVHIVCALLLFACVRLTLQRPGMPAWLASRPTDVAFAVALVWLLHPLNTEAVDYVTQRTESMMAAFYLLTIYASIRAVGSRRRTLWEAAAAVSCVAGMGCKESMVTAPIVVVLYDAIFVFGSPGRALRERGRFYGCLAATWLVLAFVLRSGPRIRSAGFSAGITPWTYLLNQTVMIARYLRLSLWPDSLVLHYGLPRALALTDVLPYAVSIVFLMLATMVALRRRPAVGFLGAWFFITLAPTSSLVPIATEVGAERRMYLPLMAIVLLVGVGIAWAAGRVARPRATALALSLLIAVPLAATTVARNREYASPLVMAQTVLERWPTPLAESMVGQQLAIAGRHDEAIAHLRAAAPGYPRARYHLGGELFNAGRIDEAMPELQAFVAAEPALVEAVSARTMLGRGFMLRRQWPQAEEQLRMVLTMMPTSDPARAPVIGGLADTLFQEQRFEEAASHYRAYLVARPTDGGAATNLGIALAAMGKDNEAIAAFRLAVQINPRDLAARRNLELALESTQQKK
jgi:tetratricopeptide (TPR) repeat protein